nr:MAG TPA: hypothetical protein [Caudoviricetes sp.]
MERDCPITPIRFECSFPFNKVFELLDSSAFFDFRNIYFPLNETVFATVRASRIIIKSYW